MPGNSDAPLILLDEKASTADVYAFVDNNGFGGQGAETGLGFGTGDTDGDTSEPDDTSVSSFYGVFIASSDRTSFGAFLNANDANGSLSIGSTDAPSIVEFDDVFDLDGASDALFL